MYSPIFLHNTGSNLMGTSQLFQSSRAALLYMVTYWGGIVSVNKELK